MTTPTDITRWDPSQAVTWVSGQVDAPSDDWKGMCLALTANAYGYGGSGVNSAADYWYGSWHQHPGDRDVPTGGLACFTGGGSGFGHIMTAVGGGRFASNDIYRTGKVDYCTIADIEHGWGQHYVGWAEPCYWNGWGTNPDPAPPSRAPQPQPPDDDTELPIFLGTTAAEGGRIYRLIPGRPKEWLTPDLWGLYARLYPQWAALPGSPFLEAQVDLIDADIQP